MSELTTHRRKKIEMIVESALIDAMIEVIEACGAQGYTIIPDLSGSGHHGRRGQADFVSVLKNVMIIVIAREDVAKQILVRSQEILADGVGIVVTSDVEVIRADHF